ncbi:MAG: SDR family oxidoreductase [Gemmatimonadetes bacterium]|nr:SDR family oxidoreductase [Gemmatimonadota bacterium]
MAQDRFALVTGGSRGIGRAIALELADRGYNVAFCFLSNRSAAEETKAAIEERGVRALSMRAHVGREAHLDKLFAWTGREWGALDVFVANAAMGVMKPALELTSEDWDRAMETNAKSFLLSAQRAAPLMAGRAHARIIAITSFGSRFVLPGYAAIGASKAALEALVRYLAVELKLGGINVNAVSAGVVETRSLDLFSNRDEVARAARERTPGGTIQTAEEVARVVGMLTEPAADWLVGEIVNADGGFSHRAF